MSKPLSLLVLTELFLPTKGGTAVWFAEIYRRLGGKEIHIVTADVPGAADVDATHPNTIHRLNLKRVPWLRPESLGIYWRFFARSLKLALRHRFTAVHAGRVLPEGLMGLLVARLMHIPAVIYAHGEEITTWRQRGKFKAMRFAFRHADKVVANSEFTREQLLKLGVATECITIITPGVDTDRFKVDLPCEDLKLQIDLAPEQQLILSVGRLSRRKGFDMVIRAIPTLIKHDLDVQYALIGIGEDRDYLLDLASKLGISNRVHLLGHVAPDDLPRWYNACDVFVMPNREIDGDTEGFGMVFVEAAACGKATIAGCAGGTADSVVDGVTGLRVDGSKIDDVVDALIKLLSSPSLLREMGAAGHERVLSQFSWDGVAELTAKIGRKKVR